MIAGFLDKIGGFFDKPFFLAAVFPLLGVGSLIFVMTGWLLGFGDLLLCFDALSSSARASLAAVGTIALFIGAFALRSLRSFILGLWCGWRQSSAAQPHFPSLEWQHWRRTALEAAIETPPGWKGAADNLNTSMRALWKKSGRDVSEDKLQELREEVGDLEDRCASGEPGIHTQFANVSKKLGELYSQHSGPSLDSQYARLLKLAEQQEETENIRLQTARVQLSTLFGPTSTLRATTLGNIVEALDAYPFIRYSLEGSIFWPHIEQIIKAPLADDIANQRMTLDLLLALATFSAMLAAGAALIGPWIYTSGVWFVLATVAITMSYGFYRVSIQSALSLSLAMRAGYDLYRHELLTALDVALPSDLAEERTLWRKLSQLAAYGETMDLAFRPKE